MASLFGNALSLAKVAEVKDLPITAETAARMEPTPPIIEGQHKEICDEFLQHALESKANQLDWGLIHKVCDEFLQNQKDLAEELDRMRDEHKKLAHEIIVLRKQQWKIYVKMISLRAKFPDEDKKKRIVLRIWKRILKRCAVIRQRVIERRVAKASTSDESYDNEPWSDEAVERSVSSKPIDSGIADESEIGLEDPDDGVGGGEGEGKSGPAEADLSIEAPGPSEGEAPCKGKRGDDGAGE